jgi:hypothetical protein
VKEKLCVQEHVQADLCEDLLKLHRAHALRYAGEPECLKDFVDPGLERRMERSCCHVRIQHDAENARRTEVAIDVFAEGLLLIFIFLGVYSIE